MGGGNLKSTIYPNESRGYISWNDNGNRTYKITLYQIDENGDKKEIESFVTKNKSARISRKYLANPSIVYTISSFTPNGNLVTVSEDQWLVNPDYNPFISVCSNSCNGKTYAYSLNFSQQFFNNDGIFNINDPGKMFLTGAYDVYDLDEGIAIPYWQAISSQVWSQLPTSHPYKQISSNTGEPFYKRNQIQTGSTYFDAQNNPVTSGWLIEKKTDQFKHMELWSTNIIQPSATFCEMNTTGWMGIWNNTQSSENPPLPTSTSFSVYYGVPTTIQCLSSGLGSSSPTTWTDGDEWEDYKDDFIEWLNDINDWFDENGTFGNINGADGLGSFPNSNLIFSDIVLNPIGGIPHRKGVSYKWNTDSKLFLKQNKNKITIGLYEIILFANDGRVLRTVIQLDKNQTDKERREFVELEITPNPIENQRLKINIGSEKSMQARLKVFTLDGSIITDELIQLEENHTLIKEYEIQTNQIPFQQIRTQLLFDDNTTIEKTALF